MISERYRQRLKFNLKIKVMRKIHTQNLHFKKNNNVFLKQSNNHVNKNNANEQIFICRQYFDSREEAETAIKLAIGRILQLGSRASLDGDIEIYYKCKDIIKDANDYLNQLN